MVSGRHATTACKLNASNDGSNLVWMMYRAGHLAGIPLSDVDAELLPLQQEVRGHTHVVLTHYSCDIAQLVVQRGVPGARRMI